jgi:hypothetical protein
MPAQMVVATSHHYLHYLPDVNLPWKVFKNGIVPVPILPWRHFGHFKTVFVNTGPSVPSLP